MRGHGGAPRRGSRDPGGEGGRGGDDAGLIADAQRVEHYEIAAYGSAIALAAVLGHNRIADLLGDTIAEEIATDQKLSLIAERQVNPQAAALSGSDHA